MSRRRATRTIEGLRQVETLNVFTNRPHFPIANASTTRIASLTISPPPLGRLLSRSGVTRGRLPIRTSRTFSGTSSYMLVVLEMLSRMMAAPPSSWRRADPEWGHHGDRHDSLWAD